MITSLHFLEIPFSIYFDHTLSLPNSCQIPPSLPTQLNAISLPLSQKKTKETNKPKN